jgi:serine/threonine protein phosphatase PrpC
VEKEGGYVEFIGGKWRLNGKLSVTRAFGNENLKPLVTANPDICKFSLNGLEEYLLLSCDGIYDVMTDNEICAYLTGCLKAGLSVREAANGLVTEALKNIQDDITGKQSLICSVASRSQ